MTNQQELLAIFIPSFLILAAAFINWQGIRSLGEEFKDLRREFTELRRDVKAETESLRTIAYQHVQRIRTLEVEGKKQA